MAIEGRLGLIGCVLMGDEITHMISQDNDVSRVLILENEESEGIASKLSNLDVPLTMIEEDFRQIEAPDGFEVLIWMKPMALHEDPNKLKNEVLDSLRIMDSVCDSILLFYGLCGNAFERMEEVRGEVGNPIHILTDEEGETVDDCIGAVVGGKKEYLDLLRKYPGVMYLTPMWADNWREMLVKTGILPDADDLDVVKTIFEMTGYEKVLKIDTGLGAREEFDEKVEDFAKAFDFKQETYDSCTLKVIAKSWEESKKSIA